MPVDSCQKTPNWYVLNYIGGSSQNLAQKTVDRFNASNDTQLELFAPTYVIREVRQGELKFRTASLTFHYVFVKGLFDEVKRLCAQTNGFSFLIDRGNDERYAIIDDRKMTNFRNIARAYKNCLPYFSLDDIDLESGDLVEVVRGDFPGLVGYYIPRAKSNSGNIVLNVYNKVGTMAFNVKATDVRVLEFSKNSTRANDQIDAFVPNLLKALRLFDNAETLTDSLAAKLSVFCGRMSVVKLANRKLDARLQVLLYAANYIMGNTAEANRHYEQYEILSNDVTNEWTRGLINLITSVINRDNDRLVSEYDKLTKLGPSSRAQQALMDEYRHYLPVNNQAPPQ